MEVWYALKDREKTTFLKEIPEEFSEELFLSEVAVFLDPYKCKDNSEYFATVEEGKISGIYSSKYIAELYEDLSKFTPVSIEPITRCERCGIISASKMFYWDYNKTVVDYKKVLGVVCLPTEDKGDRTTYNCLVRQTYSKELRDKPIVNKKGFIEENTFRLPLNFQTEDYLSMAKGILRDFDPNFKFFVGQKVKFGSQSTDWQVYSRYQPDKGSENQYYLTSLTSPSYLQWALEGDLSDV